MSDVPPLGDQSGGDELDDRDVGTEPVAEGTVVELRAWPPTRPEKQPRRPQVDPGDDDRWFRFGASLSAPFMDADRRASWFADGCRLLTESSHARSALARLLTQIVMRLPDDDPLRRYEFAELAQPSVPSVGELIVSGTPVFAGQPAPVGHLAYSDLAGDAEGLGFFDATVESMPAATVEANRIIASAALSVRSTKLDRVLGVQSPPESAPDVSTSPSGLPDHLARLGSAVDALVATFDGDARTGAESALSTALRVAWARKCIDEPEFEFFELLQEVLWLTWTVGLRSS